MARVKANVYEILEKTHGHAVVGCGNEEIVCSYIAAMLMDGSQEIRIATDDIDPTFKWRGSSGAMIRCLHSLGFVDYCPDVLRYEVRFKLNQRALDYLASCQ